MTLMLNTNACIYLIRNILPPSSNASPLTQLGTSVSRSLRSPSSNTASARAVGGEKPWEALDQFISPLEVSPFDRPRRRQPTASCGQTLEKKGQSIGSMDLLIAAHALSLGVRLDHPQH